MKYLPGMVNYTFAGKLVIIEEEKQRKMPQMRYARNGQLPQAHYARLP